MATPEREIQERIAALTPAQKRRVMDYLRDRSEPACVKPGEEWHRDLAGISDETAFEPRAELAADRRVTGTSGRDLLRFAGIWTNEEADEIKRLIEDAFERVEPDVW
jgi:hypothetical protein